MRSTQSLVALLAACAVAALAVLAVEWPAEAEEFDREGSRTFTREALEDAGLDGVEVSSRVRETEYRPRTFQPDDPPLQVYRTTATAEGGTVELLVHGASGRAVYLRDVATDGGPLLDDEQYRRLRAFAWTDEAEATERRRLGAAVAAALLVLAAAATAVVARRDKMAA